MLGYVVREGKLPGDPLESELIKIWQHQLMDKTELVTEDGEPIRIIYPGRVNDDQGADFRDAVIAAGRELITGDVEVHVRSSNWQAHRHHYNAAYNRVILHVVMWHNQDTATRLQNGTKIPVLALYKYVRTPIRQRLEHYPENLPCATVTRHLDTDVLLDIIDKAGEERFLAKAAKFKTDLLQMEPSQALYLGIMVALGYSKNRVPFAELARRLPFQVLESTAKEPISDEDCLSREQALLLATAGLSSLDEDSEKWGSRYTIESMSPQDWQMFKVRPNNSPVRRIIAMSRLLIRYRRAGILKALIGLVNEASVKGWQILEKGLLVIDSEGVALLGKARADDIIVNVLLPFTFAFSQSVDRAELGSKAFNIYRNYPRLAANSIERHMIDQFGLGSTLVNSALRQQGLIHIYHSRCIQGGCHECRLS